MREQATRIDEFALRSTDNNDLRRIENTDQGHADLQHRNDHQSNSGPRHHLRPSLHPNATAISRCAESVDRRLNLCGARRCHVLEGLKPVQKLANIHPLEGQRFARNAGAKNRRFLVDACHSGAGLLDVGRLSKLDDLQIDKFRGFGEPIDEVISNLFRRGLRHVSAQRDRRDVAGLAVVRVAGCSPFMPRSLSSAACGRARRTVDWPRPWPGETDCG